MHKAAETTGEFIGDKVADKIVKVKPVPDENSRDVEEIVIPSERKRKNIKLIKVSIIKWKTIKYLNYKKIQLYHRLC